MACGASMEPERSRVEKGEQGNRRMKMLPGDAEMRLKYFRQAAGSCYGVPDNDRSGENTIECGAIALGLYRMR